jgi:hypothetical protein
MKGLVENNPGGEGSKRGRRCFKLPLTRCKLKVKKTEIETIRAELGTLRDVVVKRDAGHLSVDATHERKVAGRM